jgi:AraC family transcriptional regulator of arabinose operon
VDYRVQQAISLIRDGSHKKFSVAALARDVGLSSSRFHHLFKAETGRSPAQYLHDFRMEQAEVLLKTTELTIEQILLRFGIKDRSHFEREFKKMHGLTPTQYRIAARMNGSAPVANSAIRRQNSP